METDRNMVEIRVNKIMWFLVFLFAVLVPVNGQDNRPSHVNSNLNLVYFTQGDVLYYLDLYGSPVQEAVSGKDVSPLPVVIWLPKAGIKKYPCPAASFTTNGYAIISVEHSNDGDIIKTISRVTGFIRGNARKFSLDPKNIGVIQQVERGYLAVIWEDSFRRLQVLSDAPVRIGIAATDDSTFTAFRKIGNIKQITGFFDRHLRGGVHKESAPPDSISGAHK